MVVLFAASVGAALHAATPAAQTMTPDSFRTSARFSVDAKVLNLRTAVAMSSPHARYKQYSWLHVYFYSIPMTAADVAAVTDGRVDTLEERLKRESCRMRAWNCQG